MLQSMKSLKSQALLTAMIVTAAACHTRPPAAMPERTTAVAPAAPSAPPPPAPPPRAPAPAPVVLSEQEIFARKSLDQLNAEHPLADVFFDLDQNTLRDDGRSALQEDARWLKRWPSTAIRIDGHCDDRGTSEYNLALGDRRADVAKDYLVSLGVDASRIQVRSLGKEAPFCREDGESCWSQNRRGHFVITGK